MIDGILPLWKEIGMTSHDAVYKVRKILKTKKVGHSGTLDPNVDGVLPICVGRATKIVEYLVRSRKIYKGTVTLGFATTTEDATGEMIDKKEVQETIDVKKIDDSIASFVGEITQIPPMYSAVRVDGKRLYEYAREGITIERPSRKVTIHSYTRTSEPVYDHNNQTLSFSFEANCSKGTYIRTLAVDTGKLLGYPAHMSQLTRIESGTIKQEDCVSLAEVAQFMEEERLDEIIYPLERAIAEFPTVEISDEQWRKVQDGFVFPKKEFPAFEEALVFYYKNKAVAIYGDQPGKKGVIKPTKIIRLTV